MHERKQYLLAKASEKSYLLSGKALQVKPERFFSLLSLVFIFLVVNPFLYLF